MLPIKKVHLQTSHIQKEIYPQSEEGEDDDDLSPPESSNEGNSPRKQRKRRTLSETSKRDFVCGCGKSYVSYPAIYLHVQRKHNGDWPANTLIPEKSDNQDKVKRGRPKKEKHNMLDVNNDTQNEVKYRAEDNFWLFIGLKGNTGNPKLENRFITNLETQPYNPLAIFQYSELFEDFEIHQSISQALNLAATVNGTKGSNKKISEIKNAYDAHLSHFILWLSNPLKEEIFVELGIIVSLLRIVNLACIWAETQENAVIIKEDQLDINVELSFLSAIKLSESEKSNIETFAKHSVCPILCSKWVEIKKAWGGNILLQIITQVNKTKEIEELFYTKLQAFSNTDNDMLECVAQAILNLKDSELKEIAKTKRKFYFLNWNTKEDLKELIQKLCEWLQFFDEKELQLQDTGL